MDEEVGEFQCFTFFQTNRLSDVIVFRDVLYVWLGMGDAGVRGLQ